MVPPSLKILAVDDGQLLLVALERAGKVRELEIKTAETMDQALNEIKKCNFDLFLLDLEWQNRNGVELLRHIDQYCPYIPVIIMTTESLDSYSLNEKVRTVRQHGTCHVLEKPFRLDRMIHLIDSIFHNQRVEISLSGGCCKNMGREKRACHRRAHVKPVTFSFNTIVNGNTKRVSAKGIVTDISDFGSGMISNLPIQTSQVLSFDDDFKQKTGTVAWSTMISKNTCRFGLQFC